MEPDLQQNHHNLLNQNQMNSSLMRYKSAPSSYFANFLESEDCEEFLNQRATSPETERSIISRFFSTNAGDGDDELKPEINQLISPMKVEAEDTIQNQQIGDYNSSQNQQIMYQNNSNNRNPLLLNRSNSRDLGSAIEGSFRVPASSSMGMDQFSPLKIGTGGSNSNLIRHSSSPAGLFSDINIDNGFVTMRGMSNLGGGNVNGTTNGETPFSSSSRMRSPMKFTSGAPSSSGLMSPILEYGNKNIRSTSPENENFGESRSNNFINGFPIGSWDDSPLIGENFSGFKRARDDDRSPHSGFETQSEGIGNRLPRTALSHHSSLPKSSIEMAAMENLLQLEDSVPWKIRAKRGCATHPRSIAERVRRTRISERMRKLQELVPNMDKQTNTADMLDLAVDYIKDLQKEVKVLSDSRANCTCSSSHNM